MQSLDINTQAFLTLMRAGLWEQDARLSQFKDIDWQEVYRLAAEQSVLGLALAGLEYSDVKPPKELLLLWIGEVQQIEQRNKLMDRFVSELIDVLRKKNIYSLLVKGQGVAQCYKKPLWRTPGDIDLLLSDDNYKRAQKVLVPLASEVTNEEVATKHQALVINGFDVELHGKMPFIISKRVDVGIDEVLYDIFCRGNVRSWDCNGIQVFLPSPNNDLILVFTHFLHHFFIEGVGLRQICDWCRLLWTHKDLIDLGLLESRIRKMGLLSEWKVFASLAVEHLGMPEKRIPFYDNRKSYSRRANRALSRVFKTGNMGHNNDNSYRGKHPRLLANLITFLRRIGDFARMVFIFPVDSPKFFATYVIGKLK